MTFTDLCNEIKKKNMVDRVLTVLFVICVFGGLVGFGCLAIRDEMGRDVAKRNEELHLRASELYARGEYLEKVIEGGAQVIKQKGDAVLEKDKEIAGLNEALTVTFRRLVKELGARQ